MSSNLHGVIPALVTPRCDGRDEPDVSVLKQLIHWLLEQGVHGVFPCSSTGEAPLLSWKQRRLVIETVVEAVANRVPVLAGAGAASTAESLRLAREAHEAGATYLAVLPMHFAPVSQEELYGYFSAVADSVDIPTLLYNFPARTGGQNIAPGTAARLAKSHNVVGLKDSSGDLTNSLGYLEACPAGFALFVGSETLLAPAMMMGGAGTICAGANVLPRRFVELYDACVEGDWEQARRRQEAFLPWETLIVQGTFPAAVKASMAALGQSVGDPFLPVGPVTERQREIITAALGQIEDLGT